MANVTFSEICSNLDYNDLAWCPEVTMANIPSQYVGSEYWIFNGQRNGRACYYQVVDNDDQIVGPQPQGDAYIWCLTLIPLNHCKVNNIQANLHIYTQKTGHSVQLSFGVITNGVIVEQQPFFYTENVGDTIYPINENINYEVDYLIVSHGKVYGVGDTVVRLYNMVFDIDTPITYNWQSVPSISGKNGILSLTTLKDELITGDTISGLTDSDFNNFASETMLQTLVQNIPDGEEVPLIYGGQVDYLAIERLDTHLYDIKIYIGGSSTPVYSRTWTWSAGLNAYLAFIKDDENYVAKMAIVRQVVGGTYVYDIGSMTDTEMEGVWLYLFSNDNTPDDVNEPEDDGGANDPWHDTAISGLTVPATSAIETGFTSMYEMPLGNLQQLSTFLWSDSFLNNVKKFFNDPREIIVALSIMPIAPDTGTAKNIIAGGVETTAIGRPLTSQYKLVTLGSIYIKKSKKRRFLNYPPFTKITAHLPYCGEHSLDVNDIMGKTLTLKYLFDFLSGSCVAEIDVDDKPRYFYGGNCGVQIPTSSEDYSRIYSSILSAGATVGSTLSTIATKGLTAPLAISMATNLASNGMNMTPDVQYSSGSGCINGMLSSQTAFIMVETPKEKIADEQDKFIGRTSIITRVLEDCTGYTKCLSVHLDNIACLETERNEIETLLLNGVRIETGSETPTYSGNKQAIIFLKCISDKDIIGKSWLVNTLEQPSNILTLEGKLLYDKDILNPTVLISGDILAYNYCYIPLLNRFYYITGITARTGAQEEINLKCDVLQSWKSGILANQAIIERQENDYNTYLQDSMLWTQNNKDVAFIPFQDDVGNQVEFKRENNTYILTIAGSDPNV